MTSTVPPDLSSAALRERAQDCLETLAGPQARLREDQWSAISALVEARRRVVVVQRTGWGKSAVYWVATALRRAGGAGPTLVVSPLLALMRDQVAAAGRAGLRAVTLNSANAGEWSAIEERVGADDVDVLLISPERLNSVGFRSRVLPHLAGRLGMLVVDEAHCISDWGHDFRPDYRRIAAVLDALPAGTPVLATTATANARVSADVAAQLGTDTLTLRGSLDREGLALSVVPTPDAAHAYAWVADFLASPSGAGSGIIYALTVAETTRIAEFLLAAGHHVAAYSSATDPARREELEASLLAGELRALVATSSLGMGYDHPRLSFVVHVGAPSSPVAYYQQVGRAGRALDHAVGVLLPMAADERIWEYFDSTAFPQESVVRRVLDVLGRARGGSGDGVVTLPRLEVDSGVRRGRLEALLKVLDVDGAVERVAGGWRSTGVAWHYDTERIAGVAAARRAEQGVMRAYAASRPGGTEATGLGNGTGQTGTGQTGTGQTGTGQTGTGQTGTGCLLATLRAELDDDAAPPCGRCSVCTGALPEPGLAPSAASVAAALAHLRSQTTVMEPRKMWPSGASRRGKIADGLRAEPGRALALAQDPAWTEAVGEALRSGSVGQDVFDGLVSTLSRWGWPAGRPTWVTWVPSGAHEGLLKDLAVRLGALGRMQVASSLLAREGTGEAPGPSSTSAASADAALTRLGLGGEGGGDFPAGPVLLLDAARRSGWTLTVAAALLRDAGCGPVYPLVLHQQA